MTVVGICLGAVIMFFLLFGLLECSSSSGSPRASFLRKLKLSHWGHSVSNGYARLPGGRAGSDRARFEVEAEKVALTRCDEEDDEDDEIFHKTT